jgi:hypothetical protein
MVTSRAFGSLRPMPPLRDSTLGVTTSVSIGRWPRYSMRRKTSSGEGASTSPTTISPPCATAR